MIKTVSEGVFFIPERNKWRAFMSVRGKQVHVGMFATSEEAIAVRAKYMAAKQERPRASFEELTVFVQRKNTKSA